MRRREFISLLGGAAAWPVAAHAQPAKLPTIGFLGSDSPDRYAVLLRGFRVGKNRVQSPYQFCRLPCNNVSEGRTERYAEIAAEFVRLKVDVIVTVGSAVPTGPIAFVLAFSESLAFLSLFIPAWAALIAIGVLIGAGHLNFWPIWIAGAIGAALGDWLSYWLGIKIGPRIAELWPLSRHPKLLPKGEAFVRRWGVLAIFIGRFFGPLRASVPLAAGIFRHAFLVLSKCKLCIGLSLGRGTAWHWRHCGRDV